jgi:hypothetical protein
MLPPGAESGVGDLSAEAIRLTRQLALACDEPEVAGLSAGAARSRVVLARRLAERAEVRAAVCSGDLSVDHARLVTTWSAPRRPDARRVTAETTWGAVLGAAAVRRLSCDASSCGSSPRGEPAARRRPPLPHRAGGDPRRSGRPGRRLHVSRLRPATAVVRWSPHHPLGSPWARGGETREDNLILLCRRHHRTVHEGHWQITRGSTGRWIIRPGQSRLTAA